MNVNLQTIFWIYSWDASRLPLTNLMMAIRKSMIVYQDAAGLGLLYCYYFFLKILGFEKRWDMFNWDSVTNKLSGEQKWGYDTAWCWILSLWKQLTSPVSRSYQYFIWCPVPKNTIFYFPPPKFKSLLSSLTKDYLKLWPDIVGTHAAILSGAHQNSVIRSIFIYRLYTLYISHTKNTHGFLLKTTDVGLVLLLGIGTREKKKPAVIIRRGVLCVWLECYTAICLSLRHFT